MCVNILLYINMQVQLKIQGEKNVLDEEKQRIENGPYPDRSIHSGSSCFC